MIQVRSSAWSSVMGQGSLFNTYSFFLHAQIVLASGFQLGSQVCGQNVLVPTSIGILMNGLYNLRVTMNSSHPFPYVCSTRS